MGPQTDLPSRESAGHHLRGHASKGKDPTRSPLFWAGLQAMFWADGRAASGLQSVRPKRSHPWHTLQPSGP